MLQTQVWASPNKYVKSIFDSFIGDYNDGLGLGLAISRRIIETLWRPNIC